MLQKEWVEMTTIIDGKRAAASVVVAVKQAAVDIESQTSVKPGLAVIIVGDDPASHSYVGAKSRMAKDCGFNSVQYTLSEDTSQDEILRLVNQLNAAPEIHGILVQLPLPRHLDSELVVQSILPTKDVDGLNIANAGKLAIGDLSTGLVSCTPAGAMLLVRHIHGADLSGLTAVVIGRSNLFGKPMAQLLLNANATVTIAHSRTKDLPSHTKTADILIAAVGRPEMIRAAWVKPGATIIDVGINRTGSPEHPRLVGDVAFAECSEVAAAITPVPGGVGPMTIAMLMANTVIAVSRSLNLDVSPALGDVGVQVR